MKKPFALIVLSIFLSSCGDQKIDTTKAKAEMEAREIKVLSDAQILDEAIRLGGELSDQFTISSSASGYAIDFGRDTIFVKDYYLFGEERIPSGKAEMLFKAYQFNQKEGIKSEANIQKIDNGEAMIYTSPMVYEDASIGMWLITIPRKTLIQGMKAD